MNLLRSKQNKEARKQTEGLFLCDPEQRVQDLLQSVSYQGALKATAISPTLFPELALEPWLRNQCTTRGAQHLLPQLVANPTYDAAILVTRQQAAQALRHAPQRVTTLLQKLKELEPDVLWIFGLPPRTSKEAWPLRMLFPTWPVVSMMNHLPPALFAYHLFRSYLAPWSNALYPITTIFGPYIYIKKTLKWPISFQGYLAMLTLALRHMLRPAETVSATVVRYVTLVAYVGMFLYGVIQSFDLAAMLRNTLSALTAKLDAVREFFDVFQQLQSVLGECGWEPNHWCAFLPAPVNRKAVSIPPGMTGLFALWTNPDLRNAVSAMLQQVYAVDMAMVTYQLQTTQNWCVPKFVESKTTLFAMGHPLLRRQTRNPLSLDKNILITGPNAAGKTTYMKAICCNQMLAQSLGVACALRGRIEIVHAIGSFIRVGDTVGKDSLFEAEAKRCAEMIEEATRIHEAGQKALYFLDEPMHSTPPVEGAATAMAVVRHLGEMDGIRVFVTTHYHTMIELEKEDPTRFINVSMEAIPREEGAFYFPYRIRKGPSRQCIAIDLLAKKGFPAPFIQSAIIYKNKICGSEVDRKS